MANVALPVVIAVIDWYEKKVFQYSTESAASLPSTEGSPQPVDWHRSSQQLPLGKRVVNCHRTGHPLPLYNPGLRQLSLGCLVQQLEWQPSRTNCKMPRRIKVQSKSQILNDSAPISLFSFLPLFRMACNTDRTYEGAAMCLLYFFMINVCRSSPQRMHRPLQLNLSRGEDKLTSCCQVENHFLAKFTTDDIIAEDYMNVINFSSTLVRQRWNRHCPFD